MQGVTVSMVEVAGISMALSHDGPLMAAWWQDVLLELAARVVMLIFSLPVAVLGVVWDQPVLHQTIMEFRENQFDFVG